MISPYLHWSSNSVEQLLALTDVTDNKTSHENLVCALRETN